MRILVTGASGLLGWALARQAEAQGHEVLGLVGRRALAHERIRSIPFDLESPAPLEGFLDYVRPDLILNAAAVSQPADVARDEAAATRLNVDLPTQLAAWVRRRNRLLVHYSTDMAFDGNAAPYAREAIPLPTSAYGRQKVESERLVIEQAAETALVLRIPLLLGNSPSARRSVHELLFAQWSQGEKTPLFTDSWRTPVSALSVAEASLSLAGLASTRSQIWHWGGAERLNRYDLGRKLLERFGLPESLVTEGSIQDVADPVPADLALDSEATSAQVGFGPPTLAAMLAEAQVPPPDRSWFDAQVAANASQG